MASGHLNDVLLVAPVFDGATPVALTACTSHLYDLGGLGMGPNGGDVHDEGLFIPPMKLVERGAVNAMLVRIFKANSRSPESNEGDLYALVACCEVGGRRLLEMMREFGLRDLDGLGAYVLDASNAAAKAAIAEVPNGVYRNRMMLDGYDFEIGLEATMTVTDDAIATDFTGTSPCSRYGINVPLNYAAAYSVFGIRCLVGPGIPNNAGSLAPFVVSAPPGCILNAPFPAPVAMRHTIGQLMRPGAGMPAPGAARPGAGRRGLVHVGPAATQRRPVPARRQRHHLRHRADPQRRHRGAAGRGRPLRHRLAERGVGLAGGGHREHGAGAGAPPRADPGQRRCGAAARGAGPDHRAGERRGAADRLLRLAGAQSIRPGAARAAPPAALAGPAFARGRGLPARGSTPSRRAIGSSSRPRAGAATATRWSAPRRRWRRTWRRVW